MKRLFFVLPVICFLSSCKSNFGGEGADSYCDSVITIQNEVVLQIDSFFQSISHRNLDTPSFYESAIKKVNHNVLQLKKLGGFNQDNTLLLASKSVIETVDNILQDEGKRIVVLDDELLSKYDLEKIRELDSLLSVSFLKIQRSQSHFDSVQTQFLNRYGFDIEIDTTTIQNHPRELIQ